LWPLLFGTWLPDLIDKPLYYAHVTSFISCTRTFAHTGVFVLLLVLLAWAFRSRVVAAIAVGAATHVILDILIDQVHGWALTSSIIAACWPAFGWHFDYYGFPSLLTQLEGIVRPEILATEALGLILIIWEYRRGRLAD